MTGGEIKNGQEVIKDVKRKDLLGKRIGCDKGYDSEDFRKFCLDQGTIPVIGYRKSVKIRGYEDLYKKNKGYCRQRWKSEREFAHKDNSNRRVDRFYEKSISSYERLYLISVIRRYLKLCNKGLSGF